MRYNRSMGQYYYDDFTVGEQIVSARSQTMTAEAIIDFAREFDPQPQHVDPDAARHTQFGELVASGWHTGGVSVRLKLETKLGQVVGGLAGLGLETIRWPQPVRPGDALSVRVTILEKRDSISRPEQGIVRYRVETLNQQGALVMEIFTAVLMRKRPA